MGILLLLLSFFGGNPNHILILFACIGTTANPTMFIFLAFNQNLKKSPKTFFGMVSLISYVFTTVGIGGICIYQILHY